MKIKILFFLIAILVATTQSYSQSHTKDETAFKSLIKQMTDAQMAYNAAALDKILTSDYIEVSPAGEFDPRAKVLGFYTPKAKADAGSISTSLEVTDYSIRLYDKFAIAIVRLNYTIVNEGQPLPPRSMRAMVIFRKERGSWKIASAQYTGIRSPQSQKPN